MIEHQETVDFSHVPKSQGLNTGTKFILVTGVLMIFAIGGFSAFLSGYGHVWPSTHTLRIDLGKMPQ
ncbi:MAG TPA: hypothetical protein VMG98_04050 [Verrucomicrobiae bacterium]|nr:hypothetical protein [Verrucomicrobiae bacterium]HTZ55658.1 hypothetical protein [Candidatus Acidoferrum sp.]